MNGLCHYQRTSTGCHITKPAIPASITILKLILMVLLLVAAPACQLVGVVAHTIEGIPKTVNVKSQYRGLENHTVAVIVAVDEYTAFQFYGLHELICNSVSRHLMEHLPGTVVTNPLEVIAYQSQHPYWITVPYSELIETLNVDRLVVIDVVEFRLHEPGNVHLWKGTAAGNIGVIESEATDPDNFAFYTTVNSMFPPSSSVGLIEAEQDTIQRGLLGVFTLDIARLFYDYEVTE